MKQGTRNRRRAAQAEGASAKVGLFYIFDEELLIDAVPYLAGTKRGDTIREQADRADYWPTLQHVRSKLRSVNHEEIPRGRVWFMRATGRFCVDMDKALHNPKFKAAVIRKFALPKERTDFLINPHYTTDLEKLARLFRINKR
jgi:hypothetical protein